MASLFDRQTQRGLRHFCRRLVGASAVILSLSERRTLLSLAGIALDAPSLWADTRDLLLVASPQFEQTGHHDEWRRCLVRGLQQARTEQDLGAEAGIRFRLGWQNQLRGEFDEAHEHFSQSRLLYARLGQDEGLAQSLNRLAFIACMRGKYDDAARRSHEGLRLLGKGHPQQAMHYNMLGRIAFSRQEWSNAIHWYQDALAQRRAQHDRLNVARNLRDLGTALDKAGASQQAMACLSEAIDLFDALSNRQQEAVARMNLGILFSQQGSLDEALHQYRLATYHLRQVGDTYHLALVHSNVGYAYQKQKAWEAAEHAFLAAIECRPAPPASERWQYDALEGLAMVYAGTERTERAIATIAEICDRLTQLAAAPDIVELRRKLAVFHGELLATVAE